MTQATSETSDRDGTESLAAVEQSTTFPCRLVVATNSGDSVANFERHGSDAERLQLARIAALGTALARRAGLGSWSWSTVDRAHSRTSLTSRGSVIAGCIAAPDLPPAAALLAARRVANEVSEYLLGRKASIP